MEKSWQDVLARMTYGIYVLTTGKDANINGMIASWVTQVSHEPPLVLVAVHPNRRTNSLIRESEVFALHILGSHQQDFMARFKGPDPLMKFEGLNWKRGITGCPIIYDCVAMIECKLTETYQPGNHTLFIGEIVNGRVISEEPVLTTLDYSGTYTGRV